MNTDERVKLFGEMVLSCHPLYLWTFDPQLKLLESNFPDAQALNALFAEQSQQQLLTDYVRSHRKPILMTNTIGTIWTALPRWEEGFLFRVYVLGPVFTDDSAVRNLDAVLRRLRLTVSQREQAAAFLRELPVISLNRVFEYAIMLYYCVTGEQISVSDLHYQESETPAKRPARKPQRTDNHGTYAMEQEMVRMVREGNLDIQKHMNRLAVTGSIGKLAGSDPSRQMKNAVLVCIVLFSRAAIEGGLSPEIAMTLTDHYFQSVEACHSVTELTEIATTMQNDFVQRVHRCRTQRLSKPIAELCDYIHLHLEEELTLHGMAEQLKYSEYYLSRKFKQEIGTTVKDYIRSKRLEQAKLLLIDPSLEIRDISERLHFCSQSYFAESFRRQYGLSPSEWRQAGEVKNAE